MELKNMSLLELRRIEIDIKSAIESKSENTSFFEEQRIIAELENEEKIIRDKKKFLLKSAYFYNKLNEIGFTIIPFNITDKKFGIIDFSKPAINEKYYGFDYNGFELEKRRDDISDSDFKRVSKILNNI